MTHVTLKRQLLVTWQPCLRQLCCSLSFNICSFVFHILFHSYYFCIRLALNFQPPSLAIPVCNNASYVIILRIRPWAKPAGGESRLVTSRKRYHPQRYRKEKHPDELQHVVIVWSWSWSCWPAASPYCASLARLAIYGPGRESATGATMTTWGMT